MRPMIRELTKKNPFNSLNQEKIRFKTPILFKMYGFLNNLGLKLENRYILCNFIDQNSNIFGLKGDIYDKNDHYSLDQLFLYALRKARKHQLLDYFYEEYCQGINAILSKKSF